MSTRRSPASEASPAYVPAPPSVPVRPCTAPPPGARTVAAAVLVVLAGAALLNAPPPTTRSDRPSTARATTTATTAATTAAATTTTAAATTAAATTTAAVTTTAATTASAATASVRAATTTGSVRATTMTATSIRAGFPSGRAATTGATESGPGTPAPGAPAPAPGAPAPAPGRAPGAPAPAPGAPLAAPPLAAPPLAAPPLAAPALAAPVLFAGKAFDTCEAPSLTVMKAWRGSPYGAVGIYFGGRGRGCPVQKELTPAWVASAHSMGWRLLPLFVGSQAPCVDSLAKRKYAIGSAPVTQGTKEGGDAVKAAKALGIGTSSPLYLDIEAYRRDDASCAATTLAFVRAWNREVRRLGYVPGFYSSVDTGVRDMEAQRRAGTKDLPEVMWFARWRGTPALLTESVLHPDAWTPHARIHQYAGNVTETYGGRTLAIDRNAIDAPVARVTAPARSTARVPVPLTFVDSSRP
ncbi:DUF1906 domain-containing protein [Streptomyces sp. NPDC096319]|uniref:DUF1906 domain-containing protein n=1 Tax=Streptomyces sp. NPDC096319 TaxID=3366084 RepID=UPI0038291216